MSAVSENAVRLLEQIPSHVTIIGVTKKQKIENVQAAYNAGIKHLAVNYAQEGETLKSTLPRATWHFIGTIQSRKIRYLTEYEMIHSLDRIDIARSLHERLIDRAKTMNVLVQINIGNEASKSGIHPDDLPQFLKALTPLSSLRPCGLMILPPPIEPIEARRPFFKLAKQLFDRHDTVGWNTLSMGTSDDFTAAIEEGATMVRLGTVLFGARTW